MRPGGGGHIQLPLEHGAEAGADLVVRGARRAGGNRDAVQAVARIALGAAAGQHQRQQGRQGSEQSHMPPGRIVLRRWRVLCAGFRQRAKECRAAGAGVITAAGAPRCKECPELETIFPSTARKGFPMRSIVTAAACLLALPATTFAATRTYDTRDFDSIAVAAGIQVDVTLGRGHRVVAETRADDFDDLRINVKDGVLHIERPRLSWFSFGRRPDYHVRVEAPALRELSASSGSRVSVRGETPGDSFTVSASSGSSLDIEISRSDALVARSSSGSRLQISGTCHSIRVQASSGANLDAEDLRCEDVEVQASSGSAVSVAASRRVAGAASSGASVRVRGRPDVVEVTQSSGANLAVRN